MSDMQDIFVLKCVTLCKLHTSAHATFRGACDEAARVMIPGDWGQCRVVLGQALEDPSTKDVLIKELLSIQHMVVRP